MRQKRAKAYRKQMSYYHLNFKFREPYQVIIDEEIILEAVKTRYDLVKGIQRTIQAEINPMITQCTINALYQTKNQEAIDLAKTFERRRCNHLFRSKKDEDFKNKNQENEQDEDSENKKQKPRKELEGPKSAFDCITSVVNINGKNVHRYVVATQKTGLRSYLRSIPAVPLIYLKRSVMIMEPMSPVTLKARESIESSKLTEGLNDPSTNLKRKPEEDEGDNEEAEGENKPTKKRKGPKEPNPLSIKKKKKGTEGTIAKKEDNESQPKKKRRRKHHGSAAVDVSVEEVPATEPELTPPTSP